MKQCAMIPVILLLLCNVSSAGTDRPFTYLNNSAVLEQPGPSEFTFGVFGDFRPNRRDKPYPSAYGQILDELSIISPAFVMSLGDAYYGYGGSFRRFKNEVDHFLSTIKPLRPPFFNVIGNHEVTGDKARSDYLKGRFGNSYGSFDFGGSHFVVLDTDEVGREGTVSGGQLSWLEKDLEANKNAENIFVFMHRPPFSEMDTDLKKGKSFTDKANRDALHALFVRYKVRAVFAAHEHLFSSHMRDGIRYIISGGGGAPLYNSPQKGGYFHYLIVTVSGKNMKIELIPPFAIQVRTVINNYGFDPVAEVEVSNTSNSNLRMSGLPVVMPGNDADKYKVRAVSLSPKGESSSHAAKIMSVRDNGDGTSTVIIGTELPQNGLVRITVETSL